MAKYINSNSQIMGLRTVEEIEKTIEKQVRTSGIFDVMTQISYSYQYPFNVNVDDLKVFMVTSDKAIANGSNQALIGQTKHKTAYDISKALSDGEYAGGIFINEMNIVDDATVEAKEIQFGKSTLNQMWVEFDKHILGNISPDATVGLAKKLNKGLFDYITTIDNSVFGTTAIVDSKAKKEEVYKLITKKQGVLNVANGRENGDIAYVIVSGTEMQNFFESPVDFSATNGAYDTLEARLLQRNIITIYLSNQSDTRDYAILTIPSAFDIYYGAEPFRKKKVITGFKGIADSMINVLYAYNNPFIIPNLDGELGVIINGGATGINGGAVIISGASSKSNKNGKDKQEPKQEDKQEQPLI